jgi:glycosyltransferase involved in cell wall biosynthesis
MPISPTSQAAPVSRSPESQGHATLLNYVLITPARNEEELIEQTIQSVISQTQTPRKWIIVSDASTDRTDEIVRKYLSQYPWMDLIRMPEKRDRHFAAKVQCFNAGWQRLRELLKDEEYDVIGNLDADITFEREYLSFLIQKFAEDPKLGVAGTPFVEENVAYDFRYASQEHVSGACQLFRRQCFSDVGGYVPVKGGGIDWIAVTTARMKGWKTQTFIEKVCHHHRPMGTATAKPWKAWFRLGRQEYYLGNHPLWQFFRACFQVRNKPFVMGGALLYAGYVWSAMTGVERAVSKELMRFHRAEQMQRLKKILWKRHENNTPTETEANNG